MFEQIGDPLLGRREFALRLAKSFGLTLPIVAGSLLIGTGGYCYFGSLPWVDGLLNAAMILTGMGPVDPMPTSAGKLFSAAYALYSGIAFLTMMAVMMAPVAHRMLHSFHIDDDDDDDDQK